MARARQKVFTFDKTKPERASRIVLGWDWESMLLVGQPDQALQNNACNMCPEPVSNAIFLAILESLGEILAGADDAANSFDADDGDESDTEAYDMDELDIISVHWMCGRRGRNPNLLNALMAGFTRMRLQPTVVKELKVLQSRCSMRHSAHRPLV